MKNISKRNKILKINVAMILFFVPFFSLICKNHCLAKSATISGLENTVSVGLLGSQTFSEANLEKAGVVSSIPVAIGKIVGAGLAFLGIIFLVLMIYGGFIWMFARGNDQEVGKAKELIQAAVIGLVIVLSAYAVTAYIGGALT